MSDDARIAELERRLAVAEDRLELHNGAFWRHVGEAIMRSAGEYIDFRLARFLERIERLERIADDDAKAAKAIARLRGSRQ